MITVKQTKRAGGGGEEAGRRGPVHREIGSLGGGLRGERGGTKDAGEGRRGGGESGPLWSESVLKPACLPCGGEGFRQRPLKWAARILWRHRHV